MFSEKEKQQENPQQDFYCEMLIGSARRCRLVSLVEGSEKANCTIQRLVFWIMEILDAMRSFPTPSPNEQIMKQIYKTNTIQLDWNQFCAIQLYCCPHGPV